MRLTLEDAERNLRRVLAGKRPLAAVRPKVETIDYRYGDGALRQARRLYADALERESADYTATERAILETLAAVGSIGFPTLRRELAPAPGDLVRITLDRLQRRGEVIAEGPINAPRYTLGGRP